MILLVGDFAAGMLGGSAAAAVVRAVMTAKRGNLQSTLLFL
jgi:hypothetical protein